MGIIIEQCDLKTKLAIARVCLRWRDAARGNSRFWAVDVNDVLSITSPSPVDDTDPVPLGQMQRRERENRAKRLLKFILTQAVGLGHSTSVTGDFMSGGRDDYQTVSESIVAATWQPIPMIKKFHFEDKGGASIASAFLPGPFEENIGLGFKDSEGLTDEAPDLGCIWMHTREDNQPVLEAADLVRSEEIDADEFESVRREKGWEVNSQEFQDLKANFFIIRTFFSTTTNRLRSQVFSTRWGNLRHLHLTLPGSSYNYLPILQHTPDLAWLLLTFTSPPILPTDDPLTTLDPAAYPGDRAISLESLVTLGISFINNSFMHPSSQKFINAIRCRDVNDVQILGTLILESDHHRTWPYLALHNQAYLPFETFISSYGRCLVTFHMDIGAGLDHRSFLGANDSPQAERRTIHELDLYFNCEHPGQHTTPRPELQLSSLLYSVYCAFSDIGVLTIGHVVSCNTLINQLQALELFVRCVLSRSQTPLYGEVRVHLMIADGQIRGVNALSNKNVLRNHCTNFATQAIGLASCVQAVKDPQIQWDGFEACDGQLGARGMVHMTFNQAGGYTIELSSKPSACLRRGTCVKCTREVNIASSYR